MLETETKLDKNVKIFSNFVLFMLNLIILNIFDDVMSWKVIQTRFKQYFEIHVQDLHEVSKKNQSQKFDQFKPKNGFCNDFK